MIAQDSGTRYGGLSVGQSWARIDEPRITASLLAEGLGATAKTLDERDIAYKIFGGYQFHEYFADAARRLGGALHNPVRASQGLMVCSWAPLHSTNPTACNFMNAGIVSPSARAVFRLMKRSNLVGCSTGRSAAWTPLRTRST